MTQKNNINDLNGPKITQKLPKNDINDLKWAKNDPKMTLMI